MHESDKLVEISASETFSFQVPMPPIPCADCGVDLRGQTAFLADPKPPEPYGVDQEGLVTATVYKLICTACDHARRGG